MSTGDPWPAPLRLAEIKRGPIDLALRPDAAVRARIAAELDLAGLPELSAEVRVRPWHDGAEVQGDWRTVVTQDCGVTLEPFDAPLSGAFTVRCVPQGSVHAPSPSAELVIDLDADDPPDVLEGDSVDVAAYVVEHLALEIDPFPRAPGVVFEPPPTDPEPSPFAALRVLKPDPDAG